MSAPAIETRALTKCFGAQRAVDGIDLHVARGVVYGVLGPNGAGKTTTVRMLATLLRPDGGEARVLGHDLVRDAAAVRARISLTGQFASVDEDLTGRENLLLLARLQGLGRAAARARCDALLAGFDLAGAAGKQVKAYSGGMRRRLDIAASILRRPDLLFLDEPTTGLDPRSRGDVWEIVRALVAGGTTVLLTTQYLEEADQLADRIAVIDHGRVIAEGTPDALKASVGRGSLRLRLVDPGQRAAAQAVVARVLGVEAQGDADPRALHLQLPEPERAAAVVGALDAEGIGLAAFDLGQPSLDDVFFALTGHAAAAETPDPEQPA
ncbi:ATP-binding cassette domain-containing protein [Coralloluteibacterium thermophilus]|uniref:ATP-binding cassette domain-containing protein n=1 Tax=Coralloluteibacterium thermophilum TaxID=2707049 RepID=A0ABV9NH96_9GAMM